MQTFMKIAVILLIAIVSVSLFWQEGRQAFNEPESTRQVQKGERKKEKKKAGKKVEIL